MNKVAPVLCLGIGSYWIFKGVTKYHLWVSNGPGGGLFPTVAGIILIICSIILLRRYIKQGNAPTIEKNALILVAAAILTALVVNVIGMIPALGLFIVLWLKLSQKKSILSSLSLGVGTALFLYFIFDFLLRVPLPMGLFA